MIDRLDLSGFCNPGRLSPMHGPAVGVGNVTVGFPPRPAAPPTAPLYCRPDTASSVADRPSRAVAVAGAGVAAAVPVEHAAAARSHVAAIAGRIAATVAVVVRVENPSSYARQLGPGSFSYIRPGPQSAMMNSHHLRRLRCQRWIRPLLVRRHQ